MRRIQEKLPVEKTIWQPVSVPMARFIAMEQMARSARRIGPSSVSLLRKAPRTTKNERQAPSAQAPGAAADTLALD